jgi:hypothetical protein
MARATVQVGCKLPHGLILRHPVKPEVTVTLAGVLTSKIVPQPTYVLTEVEAEFWETWKVANIDFKPLKSGAIFAATGAREAADIGKERAKEKTGFEPMPTEAPGIKPASK